MSSLVERLRVRSDRRPIYNLDESDDEADLVRGKSGMSQEKFDKIVRTDAVCFLLISLFLNLKFVFYTNFHLVSLFLLLYCVYLL